MQIEIRIDETLSEPKVIILTDKVTEERPEVIAGFLNETAVPLRQEELIRAYAAGGKVFAVTEHGEYQLRLRLYELENRLDKRSFVRISNSEIINLKWVKGFDLSLSGTICVSMSNGAAAYVSRRYVARIKQVLGI